MGSGQLYDRDDAPKLFSCCAGGMFCARYEIPLACTARVSPSRLEMLLNFE